jgi:hypothetical protein
MTGPTRPSHPLSINAILVVAALCATASVLAVPKATIAPAAGAATTPAASPSQDQIQRDLTANIRAIGEEATIVFSVVDAVADAATS